MEADNPPVPHPASATSRAVTTASVPLRRRRWRALGSTVMHLVPVGDSIRPNIKRPLAAPGTTPKMPTLPTVESGVTPCQECGELIARTPLPGGPHVPHRGRTTSGIDPTLTGAVSDVPKTIVTGPNAQRNGQNGILSPWASPPSAPRPSPGVRPFTLPRPYRDGFDDRRERSRSMPGCGDTFGCDVQAICVHARRWAQVAQRLPLHPGCSRWIPLLDACCRSTPRPTGPRPRAAASPWRSWM